MPALTKPAGRIHFIVDSARDEKGQVAYTVFRGGQLLGHVERVASASWRKAGRLRTSLIGYDRKWHAIVPQAEGRGRWQMQRVVIDRGFGRDRRLGLEANGSGCGVTTRREAVELLVAWADEPERREAEDA